MLQGLVITYGYAMIAAGTFLEGETVLVIGGYLAHAGYLQLPWVMAAAFAGTFAGDQLFFFIGRKKGITWLEKRPRWHSRSERVRTLLHRHQNVLIVGFRFLYGLRTVTPFMLGASGIAPFKFFILNLIGAAVWSVVVASLGYLLGHALSMFLVKAHRYELYVVLCLIIVAATVWIWRMYRDKQRG